MPERPPSLDAVPRYADVTVVCAHPDGALASVPLEELAAEIVAAAHHLGIPAWGWAIPEWIAAVLREEFGAPFVGRDEVDLDLTVPLDRCGQQRAIGCHGSQPLDNNVPHRRMELSGDTEALRLLHDPARASVPSTPQREENPT